MSYPDKEQIGKIEQELEKAEREFRKSSEAKNFEGMMRMHNRMCQLVAALSEAYTGTPPTVFSRFYVPAEKPITSQHAVPSGANTPAAQAVAPPQAPAEQETPAEQESSAPPAEPVITPAAPVEAAKSQKSEDDDLPDISVLEKELAELAAKMQKCLEAGDMDGMLKANEGMGALSELMTKVEARNKEKKKAAHAAHAAKVDPLAKITEASGGFKKAEQAPAGAKGAGGWSTGDTMALAKQRAEERKKAQKLSDSFESVVGELAEKPVEKPAAQDAQPSSTVDMFFNDKMKSKIKDSQQEVKPAAAKPRMTQDQLREKLEAYNFYQILSVPSTASFEELHKSFFKKIRKLNQKLSNKSMEMWQFQEFVASLCLAHDVLRNPNARLQYDLVIFGTDGGATAESTAKSKLMPLKELLKFSTLISPRELADALEKHKTDKDERQVGYYLVGKGLLSNEEFDSILFAQKLVSAGKLTVAQFELAMQEMRENSIPLLDTLVASEWIQPQDVFSGDLI